MEVCDHWAIFGSSNSDGWFYFSGSPWGAGAYAGADGSRQPSALEREIARIQGKSFAEYLARITL
jgi:multimeric flavodoxin WrbA